MVGDETGEEGRERPEHEAGQARSPDRAGRADATDHADATDRDWDAEWAGITSGLSLRETRHLRGDLPRSGPGTGPRDYSPPEMTAEQIEADARYQPAVPTIPRGTRSARLAWAGIGTGLLLLLLGVLAFSQAPSWFFLLCLALVVAGCLVLFARLPGRRDDDGDDGARL